MMQPNITALVLHFRTTKSTYHCLFNLWKDGVTHAIIIDNSEDDGKSLSELMQLVHDIHPCFNAITHSENRNLGFACGVNTGLKLAKQQGFKHVLLINSDAQLEPGSLAAMLRKGENSILVYPKSRPAPGLPAEPLLHYYQYCTGLNFSKPILGTLAYASGCCLLLNLGRLDNTELFDEDFFFYGEDVVLSEKLGHEIISTAECPEACVIHEGAGSSRNGSLFYEYHINRWHLLTARKLAKSRSQSIFYFLARMVTLPLRASWRCARQRSLLPWKALTLAIADDISGRLTTHTPRA